MSLLFWRANSMARFRVREMAEVLVGIGCASCARAVKGAKDSSATQTTLREKLSFEQVKVLIFMRASSLCFGLKSGGPAGFRINKTAALQIIRNAEIQWAASALHCWPAGSQKKVPWNRKFRRQSAR